MQHTEILYAQDFIGALLTSSVIVREWNSFNEIHQLSPLSADAALRIYTSYDFD